MKKKILFIDDEKDVLLIGKMLIKSLGHEVFLADSGEEAIEFMKNDGISEIDIIFLDLMMPGIDGLEVLRFMNNSDIKTTTILQTGTASGSDLKIAKHLGAIDCMRKPYSKRDIEHFINKYASRSIIN
jgi:two-component system alkaline phosphatase synthesis response regulator PhoP